MPGRPATAPDPALEALREAVVAAGQRLGARGLISAGEGNVSVRLGGGRLLITPGGLRKDELDEDDLVVVPLDGPWRARAASRRPSSDLAIHRAVLRARPDVTAVAHAHLPASMALTLAGVAPDPAALPETAMLLPRLPVVPLGEPGSEGLARAIATALSEGPEPLPGAAILERHGAVAVGGGAGAAAVRQAVDRLELVEVLCRTWRDALLIEAAAGAATQGWIEGAVGSSGQAGAGLSFRRRTRGSDGGGGGNPGRDQ